MGQGPGVGLTFIWLGFFWSISSSWCPPSPQHPLPAVYSDLVNWGDWSLMSSRKIRTS